MHMRRPIRVPPHLAQKPPDGSIVRNRIRHGLDGPEPKPAPRVRIHHPAPIHGPSPGLPLPLPLPLSLPARILHIIVPATVRLPDIDPDALQRAARQVAHAADNQQRLAGSVAREQAAIGDGGCVVRVERAEHGALGGAGGFRVVDGVDQQREAEDVGEEDELVALRGADLARLDEEGERGRPLGGRQAGFAGEVVQTRRVGDVLCYMIVFVMMRRDISSANSCLRCKRDRSPLALLCLSPWLYYIAEPAIYESTTTTRSKQESWVYEELDINFQALTAANGSFE
ncbi:conserved hypothetical protein [Histoplasma mississippiense (nom. inval.)]|uniref:conserved hypothetical protein n=1 Tax=Ajellomyces capsulatus (strain NAm1 / WU24) TaxID=2059318 RepID=UPI000157BBBB|nr:conserved hypothetical protein [Histoplasma mississippiense (nom. inval.)]EDN05732.1 conserved hypothetical protein [Histoplasma mississippiense (nom. inval.)]